MRPTFGSVFSCIGLMDLGLERAGWECKWQVEIDEWRRRVLAAHFDAKQYADVRDVGVDIEGVDLVCAGPPCQPVSTAGRRNGSGDHRWLWPELFRVIGIVRPRFVLLENPTGLLSHGMGYVLGKLAEGGYDAEWDCIPAAALGAPHLRDRVFIVAHPASERQQGPWFMGKDSSHQPESRAWETTDAIDALLGGAMSAVCREHDGRPKRLDRRRLSGLGEAVVPHVAEWIGRRLMEVDRNDHLR